MPRKIAIIGDSHFSVETPFRETPENPTNWSWQLAKKFPQHEYYNYSRGGQSIEYFQRALAHAKTIGCDTVFLSKTHTGRMFVDWDGVDAVDKKISYTEWFDEQSPQFNTHHFTDCNYKVVGPKFTGLWLVPGNPDYFGNAVGLDFELNKENAQDYAKAYQTFIAPSESRKRWEMFWYNTAPEVYNFDNLFLVNWKFNKRSNHDEIETYNNLGQCVQDVLFGHITPEERAENDPHKWREYLYNNGLCLAPDDDHLTIKGHSLVLYGLILKNKNVLNALNS